ncbi:hypothetical protein Tco_1088974 [Tanacetum coccineum]
MVCTMAKPPKMLLYDASNTLRFLWFSVFGMMNKVTYNERIKHKWGRMLLSSFPWPSYVTDTNHDHEDVPFLTLMDILYGREATAKFSSEVWSARLYKLINLISDIMEKVVNIKSKDEIVTESVEKARSDNKRLRWSTAVEVKRTPCETKVPIKSM